MLPSPCRPRRSSRSSKATAKADVLMGAPWSETRLTAGRAFDLALATRSASGITALTAMLHAAHVARENDDPGFYPSADLVDGLFDACEALSLQVERCLVP